MKQLIRHISLTESQVVVVDANAISRTIDFMFAQDYEE